MTSLHPESRAIDVKIESAEEYVESLRGRELNVYLFSEVAKEPVDHPMIRPSFNVTAERY